ncbi:MAG: tyrosine-protein phosphatase [Planctomycetota bacterium]
MPATPASKPPGRKFHDGKRHGRKSDPVHGAVTAALLALAATATSCTGFREARPGVLRSTFQREEQLIQRIEDYDIRTVVCLRGGRSARVTARACLAEGVGFREISMSAKRAPDPEDLLALWNVAHTAARPMLIHCRAGVDRTGLASALVVLHDTGDLALARDQLSLWRYGHLAAFGTEAMDQVLDAYEPYLDSHSFPAWVEQVYTPRFRELATR